MYQLERNGEHLLLLYELQHAYWGGSSHPHTDHSPHSLHNYHILQAEEHYMPHW